MSVTIVSDKNLHYPVLLNEVLSIISPQNGGTFIDCTFGQGGYTKKILEFPNTRVIAFDRDSESIKVAIKFKQKFKNRFEFHNKKFSEIEFHVFFPKFWKKYSAISINYLCNIYFFSIFRACCENIHFTHCISHIC